MAVPHVAIGDCLPDTVSLGADLGHIYTGSQEAASRRHAGDSLDIGIVKPLRDK
jgi:hypothetical protein